MSSGYTGLAAGSLCIQRYNNFLGVDFTDEKVSTSRSPDSVNMWKNYKTLGKRIETRPEIELLLEFNNTIFGLFFYTIDNVEHMIIHSGTSLFDYNPETKERKTIKEFGINPKKSNGIIYNNIFFFIDGLNYYEYDGETFKEVEGYIPKTTTARSPGGGGSTLDKINLLSDYRKNGFFGDGQSVEYRVDSESIDNVTCWINGVEQDPSSYEVDKVNGVITFNEAPPEAISEDNVIIQYSHIVEGYKNRLKNCNLVALFDNRIFFSGNTDYPNLIMWCYIDNPRYIPDQNYATEGNDTSKIKAMVPGNNALWVFKESNQSNTTVFYHTPLEVVDPDTEVIIKTYPSQHSNISTGCSSTGINFNDDIVFFSERGLEGISNNINSEQLLGHRSTLVDRKLITEENYNNLSLAEWEGYLFVIIDNHIYLADSRQRASNYDHIEYEWFYWEFNHKFTSAVERKGILYLNTQEEDVKDEKGFIKYTDGPDFYWYDSVNDLVYNAEYELSDKNVINLTKVIVSGLYTLTDNSEERKVDSYWLTPLDDFNYPQMLKTTNKRGFKIDCFGSEINIDSKIDNTDFVHLGKFENTKGYVVAKLKRKKWNKIQLKFSSDVPFGLYQCTLESYIGSYVKR